MENYKKEFIDFMIECGVLTFGDFVTKSGRKTPFFVNTGNYKKGSQLKRLGEFYAKAIKENFGDQYDLLFGPAYKGIPLTVTTTIALSNLYDIDVDYCSNRKEIKDHGDKGILLGGKIKDGDRVLIVEDVTTAGTSIYETMPILKEQGDVDVKGLIISVDRMERGNGEKSALAEIREKFGFKTCAIVTMKEVINYLSEKEIDGKKVLDEEILKRIDAYYKEYGAK
ncbi:orotate phosphoribosyltransferase [Clostridium thermobutyricum]|uniref:Orotate phosphoribosyltransferase n=1 Tax=Clostridium thermobutyricum DSM 4928 TaxID=1121339 RepID=A0A1V4SYJ8_9CLOT|nr:orotate phosphoribosyltransferase [Clostridium thermobutyricum]OPX50124.1 orotate phosphoribosyltransferase [Clostridium thermobutyricum DSM 4928]